MRSRIPEEWTPRDAVGQFGVFTLAQAAAAGMTRAQVRTRLRNGTWVRVAGDGFVDSTTPVGAWERAHAAWLTWPGVVVCLSTAGLMHRFPIADDRLAHVNVPVPRHHSRGLRAHELTLAPDETRGLGCVVVTTPARTAIDLLGWLPSQEASSLVGWLVSRRILTASALASWLAAHPGARGNRQRRELLELFAARAGSRGELLLQQILRDARIDGWLAGESLLPHVGVAASADVYFPHVRLVIEVDGRAAHADRFQEDRTRQNALVDAGCTVLRFTWADLTERPKQVAEQIRRTLARLSRAARPDPA